MSQTFTCPCCGFQALEVKPYEKMPALSETRKALAPYEDIWGKASYEVCPCCEYEFGFDDNPGGDMPGESFEKALENFIENGCNWQKPTLRPVEWSLKSQLEKAGLPVPAILLKN